MTFHGQCEHVTTEVVEFIDNDDSAGHVECSCGWESPWAKVNWLSKIAAEHREAA